MVFLFGLSLLRIHRKPPLKGMRSVTGRGHKTVFPTKHETQKIQYMKKKVLLPAWLFIIISMLSFTSCEEDSVISDTLSGTWKGYMSVDYRYNGRVYPSSYSIIDFMKDPYTYSSGRGYWIDYYSNAPFDYIANHIEWRVYEGIIEVYFVEEDVTIEIHDYYLSDNHFVGNIYFEGKKVRFDLVHTASPNWNDYDYGWYYAKPDVLNNTQAAMPVKDGVTKRRSFKMQP